MLNNRRLQTLEERLLAACSQGNVAEVAACLKNGANINKVCCSGRTALGVVAEMGNLELLEMLLHTLEDQPAQASSSNGSNLGYFVVVHSESGENVTEQCGKLENNSFHAKGIDFDDFNDSLIERFPGIVERGPICDNAVLTPDDMDNLEWDAEINEDDEFFEIEKDPWAALYLWYANILSQTGALLDLKEPVDSVDGEDQFGCAALHYAAAEGHRGAIQKLIQSGTAVCEIYENHTSYEILRNAVCQKPSYIVYTYSFWVCDENESQSWQKINLWQMPKEKRLCAPYDLPYAKKN